MLSFIYNFIVSVLGIYFCFVD